MSEYIPQSILVTGGCGFIGANFIRYILANTEHTKVVNIDRMMYCSRAPDIHSPLYVFQRSNLSNSAEILTALKSYNIDTIVHFAAQTHVDRSFGNSLIFTEDNIRGTHTLLECARAYGKIRRFIHISTDEVYGEVSDDHEGCEEQSLLNPTNPYAATKASAEFLVRAYGHSFGIPYIITRGNNVYGKFQYPDKLIPKYIRHILRGEKLPVHGDGSSRRNFIHVDDVCTAVWLTLSRGQIGEIYNIGTESEHSVLDVAKALLEIMKPSEVLAEHVEYVADRDFNDHRYCINTAKLKNLGWAPSVLFQIGLKDAVSWYSDNQRYWEAPLKWMIFGSKGWIGKKVCAIIADRADIVIHPESRADNEKEAMAEIKKHMPDRIISLIGRTHGPGFSTIDYLEQPGKLVDNIRDNLFAPIVLARIAELFGIHFTYFGTGCIFTYETKGQSFDEEALPNFFGSQYSIVKGCTDKMMKMFPQALNIRIRMPLSSDSSPRNFINKILSYEYIHSVPNSMSVLEELLPLTIDMAHRKEKGTINMTNPGVISHNEILHLHKTIVDSSFTWKNFSGEQLNKILASERSNNMLCTKRLESLYPKVLCIRDAVSKALHEMAEASPEVNDSTAAHE